jgi:outer membrane protein OmpA-like peptidoglycan-associated protein
LAGLVSRWPQLRVQIAGYADPRGDAGENERLSAARAESVSRLLEAGGVASARIETRAHGERMSQAVENDPDAYALERRVTVRLVPEQPPGQVAHRLD